MWTANRKKQQPNRTHLLNIPGNIRVLFCYGFTASTSATVAILSCHSFIAYAIPVWHRFFSVRIHSILWLFICIYLSAKKTWGVEKSLYFTKASKKKESIITNRLVSIVSPFNSFQARILARKLTIADGIHALNTYYFENRTLNAIDEDQNWQFHL